MAEKYKKQHIVPKSYLNHFATKQKNDKYKIITMIKKNNTLSDEFVQTTDKVGYISNFYDVPEKEDPKYWEHFFDINFDRLCGNRLNCIIADATLSPHKSKIINDERKDLLSRIIMSQIFRVPECLKNCERIADETIDNLRKELVRFFEEKAPDKVPIIRNLSISETQRKDMMLTGIFDKKRFNKYCNILKSKTWLVFYNNDYKTTPFITCDNPVLVTNADGSELGIFINGLVGGGTMIYFPISPAVLIAVYSPTSFWGGIAPLDGMKFNLKDENKFIMTINRRLVKQAYRHVFIKI